ncbi:MAG: hypothetical protein MUP02_00235 [Actinobacteria bacterium]|nr:hypothetical protein [Actinomycetota bacterium]
MKKSILLIMIFLLCVSISFSMGPTGCEEEAIALDKRMIEDAKKKVDDIKADENASSPENNYPTIAVMHSPADYYISSRCEISVECNDPDGDDLECVLNADRGNFTDLEFPDPDLPNEPIEPTPTYRYTVDYAGTYVFTWTAPDTPGMCAITVEVNDGKGGKAYKTLNIQVTPLFPDDWIDITRGILGPQRRRLSASELASRIELNQEANEAGIEYFRGLALDRILFSSCPEGDTCSAYTIRPNGDDMQPLCVDFEVSEACWNSDYSRMICVSTCGGEDDRDIYECNVSTCERQSIIERTEGCDFSPHPHPYGSLLLSTGFLNDTFEIFLTGSPIKQLTDDPNWDDYPHFSPNGETIIFSSNRGGYSKLYTMNLDGNNVVKITNGDEYSDWNGSYSPDGTQIVFISDRSGNIDIWVMPVNNPSDAINLTNNPSADIAPDWSPDGSMIVFASDRDENNKDMLDIFVMDADGENQVNITPDLKDSYQGEPNW